MGTRDGNDLAVLNCSSSSSSILLLILLFSCSSFAKISNAVLPILSKCLLCGVFLRCGFTSPQPQRHDQPEDFESTSSSIPFSSSVSSASSSRFNTGGDADG